MDRKLTSGICVLISFSAAAQAILIVTTRHFVGTQTHHLTVGGLPEPYHIAGVSNGAQRAATPSNAVLNAPPDFEVSAVAEGFVSPCTLMAHPAGNGGLLVCESNAGRISFVQFRGGQEVERSTFVSGPPELTPPNPTEPAAVNVSAAACAGGHHKYFLFPPLFFGCRTPPNQTKPHQINQHMRCMPPQTEVKITGAGRFPGAAPRRTKKTDFVV